MTPDNITRMLTPMSQMYSLKLRSVYVPNCVLRYTALHFLVQPNDYETRCFCKSEKPSLSAFKTIVKSLHCMLKLVLRD